MSKAAILIVDDEPPLLKLMLVYLQRLGYEVTGAPTAAEALQCFEAEGKRFALVVADLSLPDMNGAAMALQMAQKNPALKILLCSGYPFDIQSLPAGVRERCSALQKPFLPNMLAKEVESLLEMS